MLELTGWPMIVPPVLELGDELTDPCPGTKTTAVAEPLLPQPYPWILRPISGHADTVPVAGAVVLFSMGLPSTLPLVAELGVAPAEADVGANATARACPFRPQP